MEQRLMEQLLMEQQEQQHQNDNGDTQKPADDVRHDVSPLQRDCKTRLLVCKLAAL
jgi:hypothetical protein